MTRCVHHPPQARDVAGHPGRGLVVAGENALDAVVLVGTQHLLGALQWNALAPFDLLDFHIEAQALRHVDPEVTELTEPRREYPVAGRQCIGQRRLPGTGSGGRENERLPRIGLEHPLQIAQHAGREIREFGRAVIFHGHEHGALHAVRYVGRAGNEQEITACRGSHYSILRGAVGAQPSPLRTHAMR